MILKNTAKYTKEIFLSLVGFAVVIAIWYWAAEYTNASIVLPNPLEVVKRLGAAFYDPIGRYILPQHIFFSLRRVLVGYGLAIVIGITLGIVMGRSQVVEAWVRPIFEMFRPIPGIAWIPMAILWFGIGEKAKYFIIFMSGLSHLVVNTYAGAIRVDYELIGVAEMLGASKRQIFVNVVLPSCIPYVFAGLQFSLSSSWMAVLAAEMVSSNMGTGWIIVAGMENGDTAQIFVGIISIAVVGLLLATLMRAIERRICVWNIKGT